MGMGMSYGITAETGNNIQTKGLSFYVDAAYKKSYPGSGTTWSDLVGTNNGTLTNSPTFDSSGYFTFDGTNDYVALSNSINLTNHTVSIWCNVTATTTHKYIIDFRDGSQDGVIIWSSTSETINYRINDATTLTTDGNYSSSWININGTYDGATQKLYINGTLLKNQDISKTVNVTQAAAIGTFAASPNYYFKGSIANMYVYSRALTAGQILQNYNAVKDRFGL